jgi:branched-chain amino acid transport system substrate-binding protein
VSKRLGILVAVAALVLVGCGSSKASSTGGSTSSSASRSPIQIGLITTVQSQAFSFPEIPAAARVAVQAVNDSGGVNGHPLQLDFCDDQDTPAVASACGQRLVDQDHIVALVGSTTVEGASIYPFLQSAHVADFGNYPSSEQDLTNPLSFPTQAGAVQLGALAGLGPPGTKKALLVYDTAGAIAWTFFQQAATREGIQPIGIEIAPTTVNYDPIIAKIITDKPQVVATTATGGTIQFLSAMSREGPDIPIELFEVTPQELAATRSLRQPVLTELEFSDRGPVREQFLAETKMYGPKFGFSDTTDISAMGPWLAVHLFADIAKTLPDVTASAFLNYLQHASSLQTGLTPPLDFAKPGPSAAFPRVVDTVVYPGAIRDGVIVQTSNTPVNVFG